MSRNNGTVANHYSDVPQYSGDSLRFEWADVEQKTEETDGGMTKKYWVHKDDQTGAEIRMAPTETGFAVHIHHPEEDRKLTHSIDTAVPVANDGDSTMELQAKLQEAINRTQEIGTYLLTLIEKV